MKEKQLVKGRIVQAVGPIVDVEFKNQHLPELLTALKIEIGEGKTLTVEVAQHIGDDVVRAVSMGPTEGLKRGMEVISTEKPIEVPVGRATLGRMFNVLPGRPSSAPPVRLRYGAPDRRRSGRSSDRPSSGSPCRRG